MLYAVPQRVLGVSLAGLVLMLPFSHTTAMIRLLLGVGILAAAWAAWGDRALLLRRPAPFVAAFAAWFAWSAASVAWSVDRTLTLSELRAEFLYGAAVLAIVHVALARGELERAMLTAAGVASVVLALATATWELADITSRFSAGAGYTSCTVLVLFPVGCVALFAPGLGVAARRAGLAMVVALPLAGLVTLNRTLGPALAIELVLVAVLLNGRRMIARRLAWVLAAAVVFAVLQAGVAQVARFTGEAAAAHPSHEDPRPALWSHVAQKIGEAPILGRGYGREILASDLRATFANPLVAHAHNVFLDAGVQLGIPGIVLLLALFATVAVTGLRYARSTDAVARACGIALAALCAGVVTRNLTDDLFVRQNALLFWIVVATLAAVAERRLRAAPAAR